MILSYQDTSETTHTHSLSRKVMENTFVLQKLFMYLWIIYINLK